MNIGTLNITLLTTAIGALAAAIELAKASNYIGAIIVSAIGIGALWFYEHLPATPPTLQ